MKWFKWLGVLLRCCSDAVHLWLCHSAQSWETLAWQAVASSQAKWELRADHECLYEWLWKSMWTDQLHRVQLQICPNLLSIFSIYFCFPDHRIGQNMKGLPIEFRVPCWIHGCGQKFFSVYQDEPDKNLTSRLSGFRCFAILGLYGIRQKAVWASGAQGGKAGAPSLIYKSLFANGLSCYIVN